MALRDKWPDGTNKTDEQIAAEKAGKVVENPNAPKAPVDPANQSGEELAKLRKSIAGIWPYFDMSKNDLTALAENDGMKVKSKTTVADMLKFLISRDLA